MEAFKGRPFDVIVSGHLCLDLIPRMSHVPIDELATPGRLFEVGQLDYSTGGSVSNTGLALDRLGAHVGMMASINEDLIGSAIRRFLTERNPRLTEMLRIKTHLPSSYTIVLSSPGVDRIFLHCTGTNADFGVADVDFQVAARGRIFHLGYPPILPRMYADEGSELIAIFAGVKAAGTVTSLDMSLPDAASPAGKAPWERIIAAVLPHVDIFIPSLDEIMFMLRRRDYDRWNGRCASHVTVGELDRLSAELLDMGAAIVGFKLSEYGIYLRVGKRVSELAEIGLIDAGAWPEGVAYHPAFQVNVVGTTGAGDSAYAGILFGLSRGLSRDRTTQLACAVGACNVEAADATSGIQPFDAVTQRIESGWALRQERIAGL
ncbi:MAG: carbohydrate kinase family protein [Candidatus Flexifilum sp.]